MAIHLTDLNIDQFRGIRDLHLAGLNHVNILLGDNNAGKTTILEILKSIQEPTSLINWRKVFRFDYQSRSPLYEGMLGIFPFDEEKLSASYRFMDVKGVSTQVLIQGEIDHVQLEEREVQRLNGYITTGNRKDQQLDEMVDADCLRVQFYVNGEKKTERNIYDFSRRLRAESADEEFFATYFMGSVDHIVGYDNLGEVLNSVSLQKKLVKALQIFDSSITGIQAIQDGYGTKYYVLTSTREKGVPLSLYGDGLKKAVNLISNIVYVENGILMVDEFETSVHTSAMKELFEVALQSALERNVQLFMSTHSKEAVEVLLNLDLYPKENISVHTIHREDGCHLIRSLSSVDAQKAIREWGMDLRK